MSLGFLEILLQIGLAIHAARTGRMNPWLWIILFLPGLGSLIYIIIELVPEFSRSRGVSRLGHSVVASVDPGRDYRGYARQVDIAPTVQNRLNLAEECLRLGRAEEAAGLLEQCATGLHASDPAVLFNLGCARFATGDLPGTEQALTALRAENPDFRPAEVQLLTARVLDGLGRTPEALAAYRALATTYPGEEARYRYAELLARTGAVSEARAEYGEIIRRTQLQGGSYRKAQRSWAEEARRALA